MFAEVESLMPEKTEPTPKLHLRYVRLPYQVLDICDELVYRSKRVVVGKSQITSEHSVVFDGEVVLAPGFQIVYFDLMGKWFDVGKIRNLQGRHTGYYCDIATPPRLLEDGGIELTDLFLDLWVSLDLRYKVLDEEELEEAFRKGWIAEQLYDRAKKELEKLIKIVKQGKFPPYHVKRLERRLNL
jgi:predicted RNA-binding protein associated with RNAse of E/G family